MRYLFLLRLTDWEANVDFYPTRGSSNKHALTFHKLRVIQSDRDITYSISIQTMSPRTQLFPSRLLAGDSHITPGSSCLDFSHAHDNDSLPVSEYHWRGSATVYSGSWTQPRHAWEWLACLQSVSDSWMTAELNPQTPDHWSNAFPTATHQNNNNHRLTAIIQVNLR